MGGHFCRLSLNEKRHHALPLTGTSVPSRVLLSPSLGNRGKQVKVRQNKGTEEGLVIGVLQGVVYQ